MLLGIDGKILHLKELGFIESSLFNTTLNPDKFYSDMKEFMETEKIGRKLFVSPEELRAMDDFVNDYFAVLTDDFRTAMLRSYIVGRMLSISDKQATIFNLGEINKLPKMLKDMAQEFGLSTQEVKAIEATMENGASLLTNTTASTIQTVRNAVIESIKRGEGASGTNKRLQEAITGDIGEINRDWQRVAITEVNTAFTNGYLSKISANEFVVGLSMPDACEHCVELIHGKIYKMRKDTPPDYATLQGEEREEWEKVWEKEVWEGKNNFGRSTSKQKRIDPRAGNNKENLRAKTHEERSMPVIPMHPRCRCKWQHFNPKFQFVDEKLNVRLKFEDLDKYQKWKEENAILFEE